VLHLLQNSLGKGKGKEDQGFAQIIFRFGGVVFVERTPWRE
jgi:hypothetical protein